MRSWILGAMLAGGMAFAQTMPANAQVTYSFGRSATSPNVTFGQPAQNSGYYGLPAQNNGYYTQTPQNNGYYTQTPQNNGYYGLPAQNNGYYTQTPQNNGYYGLPAQNNAYYGQPAQNNVYNGQPAYGATRYSPSTYVQTYPPATNYNSGYQGYVPSPAYSPNGAYPGYGYGNPGVNVNVPRLGPVNIR